MIDLKTGLHAQIISQLSAGAPRPSCACSITLMPWQRHGQIGKRSKAPRPPRSTPPRSSPRLFTTTRRWLTATSGDFERPSAPQSRRRPVRRSAQREEDRVGRGPAGRLARSWREATTGAGRQFRGDDEKRSWLPASSALMVVGTCTVSIFSRRG